MNKVAIGKTSNTFCNIEKIGEVTGPCYTTCDGLGSSRRLVIGTDREWINENGITSTIRAARFSKSSATSLTGFSCNIQACGRKWAWSICARWSSSAYPR